MTSAVFSAGDVSNGESILTAVVERDGVIVGRDQSTRLRVLGG